jgi:hypothetical protein
MKVSAMSESRIEAITSSPVRHLSDNFWDVSMSVAAVVLLTALTYGISNMYAPNGSVASGTTRVMAALQPI